MSLEQLLFFLILVALPLLERLVRVMRERTGEPSDETGTGAAQTSDEARRGTAARRDAGGTSPAGVQTPVPAALPPFPPVLPKGTRPRAQPLRTAERPPRLPSERGRRSAQTGRAVPAEGAAVRHAILRGDLQRAIVVAAILGPCRAIEPRDHSRPG